jgi:hypothetical protein
MTHGKIQPGAKPRGAFFSELDRLTDNTKYYWSCAMVSRRNPDLGKIVRCSLLKYPLVDMARRRSNVAERLER